MQAEERSTTERNEEANDLMIDGQVSETTNQYNLE